jgi:hypothetical protein
MTTEQERFVDARLARLQGDDEGGASIMVCAELASARVALKSDAEYIEALERSERIRSAELALLARSRRRS